MFFMRAPLRAENPPPADPKSAPVPSEPAKSGDTKAADAQPTDPKAARAEFDKIYTQYKEVLSRATDIQNRYPATAPEDRKKLTEEFYALVRSGTEMRPKLASLAETVYLADPKDKQMSEMMAALLMSSMQGENYEKALHYGKLLIDHGDKRPEVFGLTARAALMVAEFDTADEYLKHTDREKALDDNGKEIVAKLPEERRKWDREQKLRAEQAKAGDLPRVQLTIGDPAGHVKGQVVIELFENEAPNTVANFIALVNQHFYDGLTFHRVLGGFMAQGGDPAGNGSGGPGYNISDEFKNANHRDHFRGTLSMAHSQLPNSNGSQFFMCFVPRPGLDGGYTAFGRVIEGMDVVDQITRIDPEQPSGVHPDQILKAVVLRKRDHAYEPKKMP